MARRARVYGMKRNSRSFYIGNSEIRPRSGTNSETKEARPIRGTFTPGGSYQLEKFPALKNLLKKYEDEE